MLSVKYEKKQSNSNQYILEAENVVKVYGAGESKHQALKGINLTIEKGELIAIVGKSGSGKSTLLNLIGGIDYATSGKIIVNEKEISKLKGNQLSRFRAENIGFIFQFFQLIPTLTVFENVMIPMDFLKSIPLKERKNRAENLLNKVGILNQAHKFPQALSGGEQQRVAIARALANNPSLILADEPTGNLDSQTTETIFSLLQNLDDEGKTIVMVTHDDELAKRCNRIIRIQDGIIIKDVYNNLKKV